MAAEHGLHSVWGRWVSLAVMVLTPYKAAIERIADALVKRGELSGADVRALLMQDRAPL